MDETRFNQTRMFVLETPSGGKKDCKLKNSAVPTAHFDFHGAEAVELRHSLDFREAHFGKIG